jgi:aldose 1-epimerase
MYLALITRHGSEWTRRLWQQMVLRSGVLTIAVVTILVLGLALGWHAHMRGHFARLKAELKRSDAPNLQQGPRPGGQDVLVLERSPIEGGTIPEFLSATLLPGRGLNVLQITAFVPQKGNVSLLASPKLEEAATKMTGIGDDENGQASLAMGGAIEAPWAGDLFGTPSQDGIKTMWRDVNISLPAQSDGSAVATGGLLLAKAGTSSKMNVMPDGGEAEAVYDAGDFDGHWPSKMRIRSVVQLSSRAVEMKVVATNTGTEPQPVGIGWRPRFAVLGDRAGMKLRLPSVTREEIRDHHSGIPSGRLLPEDGTKYDFSPRAGAALRDLSLNDTFVHLRQAALDTGPVVELTDPANNYGLRITMLSSSVKTIHVEAPSNGDFVMVEPRFNYDDPFGKEWPKDEDTGMAVVKPGQSAQFRIRLEIFMPNSGGETRP